VNRIGVSRCALALGVLAVLSGVQAQSARADIAVAWGANNSGQLGDGTTTPHDTPMAVTDLGDGVSAVAAGTAVVGQVHSLAVRHGGAFAWGGNVAGQLGDGQSFPRTNRLWPAR
jgi:alpha-tubulin suppressor-like RCC1 family protein